MNEFKITQDYVEKNFSLKRFTILYIVALSLIALLTILGQILIQWTLYEQSHNSHVINIAGRQRMLSQKLSKAALAIQFNEDWQKRQAYTAELAQVVQLWQKSHQGLKHGSQKMRLPGNNSQKIKAMFADIEPHFQTMLDAAKYLLKQMNNISKFEYEQGRQLDIATPTQKILAEEAKFLHKMDDIVFQYDAEALAYINHLKQIELFLAGLTLLVLLLEGLFIYRPVAHKIGQTLKEMQRMLASLQTTQQQLLHAERIVSLSQLVSGITHEVNTPLGIIRTSTDNIASFIEEDLLQLPYFFEKLSEEQRQNFFELLYQALQKGNVFVLSSQERRELKWEVLNKLQKLDVESPETVADILVNLGVYENITHYFSIIKSDNNREILMMLYELVNLRYNTIVILRALEQTSKVVRALKIFVHDQNEEKTIEVNLIDNIENILTLYYNKLKYNVKIIRKYQEIPLIWGYPDELGQIWTNLMQNALHAMDNQGTLTIETGISNGHIFVKFTDTGKGINKEIIDKIFDPFFSTKPVGEGSGLGLDIVMRIIRKHGGTVHVDSRPKKTTFNITFPIQNKRKA